MKNSIANLAVRALAGVSLFLVGIAVVGEQAATAVIENVGCNNGCAANAGVCTNGGGNICALKTYYGIPSGFCRCAQQKTVQNILGPDGIMITVTTFIGCACI